MDLTVLGNIPESMRYVAHVSGQGAQSLSIRQGAVPICVRGFVLIRVLAFGLNRPDILQRKGHYAPPLGSSPILGLEVSGEIVAGHAADLAYSGLKIGQKVCALLTGGAYAEYCLAAVALCLPIPDSCTDVQAASLPESLFTVWFNLREQASLQKNQTLLVQGGSSGIGVMAIQLAKAWGVHVLVTAGNVEKTSACLKLGADLAINYNTQDFVTEVLAFTQNRGVDVVLDMVAGSYVNRHLQCMAFGAHLLLIAVQAGRSAEVCMADVLLKNLKISGSTLRAQSLETKAKMAEDLQREVWPLLAQGIVKPLVHEVFDVLNIAKAHECLEAHQHIGKIVVRW